MTDPKSTEESRTYNLRPRLGEIRKRTTDDEGVVGTDAQVRVEDPDLSVDPALSEEACKEC